jgi:hypothetical protein
MFNTQSALDRVFNVARPPESGTQTGKTIEGANITPANPPMLEIATDKAQPPPRSALQ